MTMKLQTRLGNLQTAIILREELVPVTRQPVRLRNSADVLMLLEEMTAAVRADPFIGTSEKARAVGHLAAVALKAIEANNLASRIEMLEAVLNLRSGGSTR